MSDKEQHIAIIDMKVSVFTKKGKELHGPVMNQEQMKEGGVPHELKFQISGFDKFECMKKVKEIISGIQSK